MSQRTCTIDGCERKHVARGLCKLHWKREYGNRTSYRITCEGCGLEHESTRKDGRFCSLLCRDYVTWGARFSAWPKEQPRLPVLYVRPAPVLTCTTGGGTWVSGPCRWCGETFTVRTGSGVASYCSRYCARKQGKAARRAREAGATGSFTWAEVTRKWIDNGKRCTYCDEAKRNDEIEPDHVVPLSRGGSNSIVNVVPSCGPCNRDKRNLLLTEWLEDRARRGLIPISFISPAA